MRHSCASLLLANGVPLKAIQEWLGHSDFAITANIYAHLEFDSKLASAEAMKWIENTSLAGNVEKAEDEVNGQTETVDNVHGSKPVTTRVNAGSGKPGKIITNQLREKRKNKAKE